MARTVVGHFADRKSADAAYNDLLSSGIDRDDVSIVGRGREDGKGLHDDDHVSAGEGAAVGGITGLLLGAAAMLIPGIGPLVAAGPLAAALAGAVTGAATGVVVGGITGALVDAGVPEEEARYYDERFQKGGYLLTVRANDTEVEKARMVLQRHGADMREAGATPRTAVDTGTTATRGAAMDTASAARGTTDRAHVGDREETTQLREERLRAEKETAQAGEVRVGKEVVTEQRSVDVPVTHEEVYVERRPVTGNRPAGGEIREGQEIRVPVREEEAHLEKQTVVTEEVNVGKRPVTEQEHLTGTVRREEARVETTGDVDVRGADTSGTTDTTRNPGTPRQHT